MATAVSLKLQLVPIRPGTFEMGNPDHDPGPAPADPTAAATTADDDDEHHHTVTLTRPYLLAACPVTVAQFRQFADATGYQTDPERTGRAAQFPSTRGWTHFDYVKGITWRTAAAGQPDDVPVTLVSWDDAVAFCRWAAGVTARRVRLPTEAEWEYACRAGTTGPYNVDGAPPTDLGWFADNCGEHPFAAAAVMGRGVSTFLGKLVAEHGRARPVGLKRPNAWGLHDMHGNVWQWCADAYGPYPAGPVIDPTGPADPRPKYRTARAAGWFNAASLGTSYNRGNWTQSIGWAHIGFRVAADVP